MAASAVPLGELDRRIGIGERVEVESLPDSA